MSGVVETGSTRPRPLSGGFWTLLSWLRGDEHSASSDSISSVGSDRTAVSFAFLAPAHYHAGTAPLVLPPPGPPTDSYKKRVHERNLRRQYDRDITLHRKYGLFRGGVNFDANSLPPARRAGTVVNRKDRERRAASECLQRRTAHVPGKRRAPPPPRASSPSNIAVPSSSTKRRHTRKRPAPKPPVQTIGRPNENISFGVNYKIDMNSSSSPNTQPLSSLALNSKPEKCNKKDSDFKDTKARSEKSFLKQIFENKKKNASADTSAIKILPSISELDKQAAEIIETSRSKKQSQFKEQNMIINSTENVWYCFKCSKRYDNGVNYCLLCKILKDTSTSAFKENRRNTTIYTQTEDASPSPSTSRNQEIEEKQKLKEMLKEMKDSLPKRTKLDNVAENHKNHGKKIVNNVQIKKKILELETPTLPIGSNSEKNNLPVNEQRLNRETSQSEKKPVKFNNNNIIISRIDEKQGNFAQMQKTHKSTNVKESQDERKLLNTPLRISSLLNPIYIPKPNNLVQDQEASPTKLAKNDLEKVNPITTDQIYVKTADAVREILLNTAVSSSPKASPHVTKSKLIKEKTNPTQLINEQSTSGNASSQTSKITNEKDNNIQRFNNHSRRRDLVNQLEKSISSGDERAAADAAMKLAQLRLSCSVLSFTSQILQQPLIKKNNETIAVTDDKNPKTGLESNSKFLENNKKASKGQDTHDASTSTNNILIKKYTHALSEPTVKVNEVDNKESSNKPLKIEEFPSKSTNRVTSNTSITIISPQDKSISSKGLNTEREQNKKCDQETTRLESFAQPSTSMEKNSGDGTMKSIAVWIEDKEKAYGPIRLQVPCDAVMGGLRRRAEQALGLPLRLQRWIVGKELCNDDDTTLVSLAGPDLDIPFYLCVVECDKSVQVHIRTLCEVNAETTNDKSNNGSEENASGVYKELVNLERQATVPNAEAFECDICMEHCAAGDGVVLRECVHSFCRQCMSDVIRHCVEPAVSCPAMGCPGLLHEREIRALVTPEDYERWLNRGLAVAESGTRNAFHCRTRDCTGWALCEAGANRFPCPVCKHINCVQCQAIHEGETCDQYRTKLEQAAAKTSQTTDEGTQALIQSLLSRGEALQCPECSAVITKKWGCDWVKCCACKTEICWVTRGRRWGPAGRGDTSAGCRCGVDGKRCHPSCGYCH